MKKKPTVTKLELKKQFRLRSAPPDTNKSEKKEDFYAELDRDEPDKAERDHYNQNHNCLIVAAYFIFVYGVFVFGLLMLANTTHQTDRRLSGLLAAQNAVDIRDQLKSEFGSFSFSLPWHWGNPFTDIGQKATDAVTNETNNLLHQAEQDAAKKVGQ